MLSYYPQAVLKVGEGGPPSARRRPRIRFFFFGGLGDSLGDPHPDYRLFTCQELCRPAAGASSYCARDGPLHSAALPVGDSVAASLTPSPLTGNRGSDYSALMAIWRHTSSRARPPMRPGDRAVGRDPSSTDAFRDRDIRRCSSGSGIRRTHKPGTRIRTCLRGCLQFFLEVPSVASGLRLQASKRGPFYRARDSFFRLGGCGTRLLSFHNALFLTKAPSDLFLRREAQRGVSYSEP